MAIKRVNQVIIEKYSVLSHVGPRTDYEVYLMVGDTKVYANVGRPDSFKYIPTLNKAYIIANTLAELFDAEIVELENL